MTPEILKAFAIGICASVPIGPIAILVLQKSLSYGHKAGFVTGLGATTVGTTYAVLIGVGMIIVQYTFCRIWFRNHTRGPLEGLWRKLTWI